MRAFRIALALAASLAVLSACDLGPDHAARPDQPADKEGLPIPPPPQEVNVRLMVHGDSQTGHEHLPDYPATLVDAIHATMIDRFVARHASHVFHCGDLVETGEDTSHWDRWQALTAPLARFPRLGYYPTIGNHETVGDADWANYLAYTAPLPQNGSPGHLGEWYYVEHERAVFVVLRVASPTRPADFDLQKAWAATVLADPRFDDKFKFVFFHIPPYSSGFRSTAAHARELDPIFAATGVDMVFCGHAHMYERLEVNGIPYVVTGGAGATIQGLGTISPYSQELVQCHNYVEVLILDDDGEATFTAYELEVTGGQIGGFVPIETLTLTR